MEKNDQLHPAHMSHMSAQMGYDTVSYSSLLRATRVAPGAPRAGSMGGGPSEGPTYTAMFDQPPGGWEVNIETKEVYKRTLWGTVMCMF